MQGTHQHIHFEISGVDIELFVGSESETHIPALGVGGSADDDVGGGFHLEHGRDQEFRLGLVGIDVIAARNAEQERDGNRLALHDGHDWNGGHLY
jgi:hypothetical protein